MFKQLEALSKVLNLNVSIQKKGELMTVVIILSSKDNETDLNLTPIFIKATADELDAKFVEELTLYTNKNLSTLERINFISESVTKAEKVTNAKATVTKKSTPKKAEPKKEEPKNDLFAEPKIGELKSSKAKSKTAGGKATVTGTLTAKVISEDEQQAIEDSFAIPQEDKSQLRIDKEAEKVEKIEKPKPDPATSPKDLGEAKKKSQGLPFVNRRGVLVNTDGTIYVPITEEPIPIVVPEVEYEEEVPSGALEHEPPIVSGFDLDDDDFNFDFEEKVDPKQVLFDRISKLAKDNNITLDGFVIETQTIERMEKLQVALNTHIQNKK